MSLFDHISHNSVVRKVVYCLQILLQKNGSTDQIFLLLIDFYVDIVIDPCIQLRLEYFDLLVASVVLSFPIWKVHLFFLHFFLVELLLSFMADSTRSTTTSARSQSAASSATLTHTIKFDTRLGLVNI